MDNIETADLADINMNAKGQFVPPDMNITEQKMFEHIMKKASKLKNLTDPKKGQLFFGHDMFEDFDEFDNVFKNLVLTRFRRQADKQLAFNQDLNKFVSRMYRLDDKVKEIVPGKMD